MRLILMMMRQSRAISDLDGRLDLSDEAIWGRGLVLIKSPGNFEKRAMLPGLRRVLPTRPRDKTRLIGSCATASVYRGKTRTRLPRRVGKKWFGRA